MARWSRPRANHALRADDARRHPGMWIEVGIYPSMASAKAMGSTIRSGRLTAYAPLGAFETRTALVDDGTALYARYTGGAS